MLGSVERSFAETAEGKDLAAEKVTAAACPLGFAERRRRESEVELRPTFEVRLYDCDADYAGRSHEF